MNGTEIGMIPPEIGEESDTESLKNRISGLEAATKALLDDFERIHAENERLSKQDKKLFEYIGALQDRGLLNKEPEEGKDTYVRNDKPDIVDQPDIRIAA